MKVPDRLKKLRELIKLKKEGVKTKADIIKESPIENLVTCCYCNYKVEKNRAVYLCNGFWRCVICEPGSERWMKYAGKDSSYYKYFISGAGKMP